MRGRNSTLSNSSAMTLTTSFLHHRANGSLKTATKLNDVQPKTVLNWPSRRSPRLRLPGFVIQIIGGRERRFGQAACLTIAQRFGRSSALPRAAGWSAATLCFGTFRRSWHAADLVEIGARTDIRLEYRNVARDPIAVCYAFGRRCGRALLYSEIE